MSIEWGKITAEELLDPIQGKLVSGPRNISFAGLSTDSRKAGPGEVFWALKGEKYDGHDFLRNVIQEGVSGVVIRETFLPHLSAMLESDLKHRTPAVITVGDTLKALGDLSAWWRRQYDVSIVAITGSIGKTTTKEMCAHILERQVPVLKSQGNFNNLIGVPLTLLRLGFGTSTAVLELGMNRPGEIARLTQITDPDVGVITNVAKVHLEGLGTIEQVAKAKGELIQEISPGARIVLNGDDGLLMDTARRFRQDLFTFGLGPRNDVFAEAVHEETTEGISFTLRHRDESWPVHLKVPGRYNVQNALAAAAVGFVSGSAPEHILTGLEEFRSIKGRFAVERLSGGITIIDDTYNSNPTALQAALDTGKSMVSKGGRFVVVLGDMLELGDSVHREHRAAGRLVADLGTAFFVVMGTYAQDMVQGAKEAGFPEKDMVVVDTHDQMVHVLRQVTREGDIILFKASRLIRLEKAVEAFKLLMEQGREVDAL